MKVLGVCSYPTEAAATRFRLAQYSDPLRDRGIELTIRPFLGGSQFSNFYGKSGSINKLIGMIGPLLGRFADIFKAKGSNVLLVQREAMFFGPPFFEWLYRTLGDLPMVLDLDDATYVPYVSPSYGKIGSILKFQGKTDKLIEQAEVVICGNRIIAEYVESKGTRSVTIPTVVDTDRFCPVQKDNEIPVLGWIGTHSTFPVLESIFPVLQRLARKHQFLLKIVGAGRGKVTVEGVNVVNLDWELDTEVSHFQSLDVGLYPITVTGSMPAEWIVGKSGFKAIQYFAVGVPFVMSPIGVCAELGEPSVTHFNASTDDEWFYALDRLLSSPELRRSMGDAGRKHSLENYRLDQHANTLAYELKKIG